MIPPELVSRCQLRIDIIALDIPLNCLRDYFVRSTCVAILHSVEILFHGGLSGVGQSMEVLSRFPLGTGFVGC